MLTPAAVAAFMQLREEMAAEFARLRRRMRGPGVPPSAAVVPPTAGTSADAGPVPIHRPARRAA